MILIKVFLFMLFFVQVKPFLPYSLSDIKLMRSEDIFSQETPSQETTSQKTTSQKTTSQETTSQETTSQETTSHEKATETDKKNRSIFDEHEWLDNIIQLVCERVLRLVKLLIQKIVFKQNISLSEIILTTIVI